MISKKYFAIISARKGTYFTLELIPQLMAGFVQSLKQGEQFKVKI